MPSSQVHAVTLACHPGTPAGTVRRIAARVTRKPDATLAVAYVIEADRGRLRVPARKPPRTGNALWRHTCCELFVAREGLPAYHEFNFSPSGEWAVYAFAGYRARRPDLEAALPVPRLEFRSGAGALELDAEIRLDLLSPRHSRGPLSIALSAVVEDGSGGLSYWALRHPPGNPDFHHAHGFALRLGGIPG